MQRIIPLIQGEKFLKTLHQPNIDVIDGFKTILEQKAEIEKLLETSNSEKSNEYLKKFIKAIQVYEGMLYIYNYLYPAINAIRYSLMNLHVDNYIEFLKSSVKKTFIIGDLELLHCLLCSLDAHFKGKIINTLNIDFVTSSILLQSLKNDKYEIFQETIVKYNIDITNAKEICELHQSCIFNIESQYFFQAFCKKVGNVTFQSSPMKFTIILNDIPITFEAFEYIDLGIIKLDTTEDLTTTIKNISEKQEVIDNNINYLICIIISFYHLLDKTEQQMITNRLANTESVIYNNYFTQLYCALKSEPIKEENILYKNLLAEQIKNAMKSDDIASIDNVEKRIKTVFYLPSDLFETNQHLTYHNKNEFFNLKPDLKIRKYPELLERLINELADWGYIENNLETKRLFAYRFTGKVCLRPEKFNKIHWKEQGRSKRGVNLLYILINMTVKSQRYNRAKEFFTGIEWGEHPNQDANPKNASCELKKLLHKISPDDFPDPNEKLEDSSLSQSPHRK